MSPSCGYLHYYTFPINAYFSTHASAARWKTRRGGFAFGCVNVFVPERSCRERRRCRRRRRHANRKKRDGIVVLCEWFFVCVPRAAQYTLDYRSLHRQRIQSGCQLCAGGTDKKAMADVFSVGRRVGGNLEYMNNMQIHTYVSHIRVCHMLMCWDMHTFFCLAWHLYLARAPPNRTHFSLPPFSSRRLFVCLVCLLYIHHKYTIEYIYSYIPYTLEVVNQRGELDSEWNLLFEDLLLLKCAHRDMNLDVSEPRYARQFSWRKLILVNQKRQNTGRALGFTSIDWIVSRRNIACVAVTKPTTASATSCRRFLYVRICFTVL